MRSPLRFTTWLSPGLPEPLFRTIADHVADALDCEAELTVEPKISGPLHPHEDRFALGLTDIGFLCPPTVLWLTDRQPPSVRLVPAAPVYDDPRGNGRPVYFSDIITRSDSGIESFEDLKGRRVGFNEPASLSGYVSLIGRLASRRLDPSWFATFEQIGSHRKALEMIEAGDLDAAAVDTNVWRTWLTERGSTADSPASGGDDHRLVAVDHLGPNPVQPVVVAEPLADELLAPITEALLSPALAAAVARFGIVEFAPVTMADYEIIRPMLDAADALADR